MAEGVLEREYIHSSSYRLRGMAVPQLVWVNVESSSTSPFAANISNCLAREVSFTPGTREDEIFRIAAAQLLKKVERCRRYADSASLRPFAEEVNLASIIECLDVFPTDNRDLRDPATQQVTPLNQGVVALGVAVEVSGSGDGRKEQADLLFVQRKRRLLGMKQRAARHRVTRHPCDR